MLNKIRTELEIFASKVDHPAVTLKTRTVPEKLQVTRGFMLWFFLNWGIDYRIKNEKTNSGRITFLILTTLFPTVICRLALIIIREFNDHFKSGLESEIRLLSKFKNINRK
jgi:hypothetical protein